MKLSVNWLREYVETKLSAEKIADALTMAGLEVDEIISGHNCSGVVVGKVVSLDSHPNADKLRVAKVDVGSEVLQIVCGASNLAVGQTVPVAIVGAKLGDFEISKASLRGVDSYGMICSEKELELGDDHSGIMVLEKGHQIGELFVSDKDSDTVLDVKVLANRSDCMSVMGLAREVAVVTGSKLKTRKALPLKSDGKKVDFSVLMEESSLCPRYMARFVTGIEPQNSKAESPEWMRRRLISSGVRPIGLLVDISNYVMLEYGQPLHFFDLDKLTDRKLIVRSANKGETITTLDGTVRKLSPENLVIADTCVPVALAGVMGGLDTEISETTRNILIEAAVFDKASIRRTSRMLGLRSEAVARFEKGISVALPELAIERAVTLMTELAGGSVSPTVIDKKTKTTEPKPILFEVSRMNAFLGTTIPEKKALEILESLGFLLTGKGNSHLVSAPLWRNDIVEAVDLYEEVIRIVGYDQVPATLPQNVESVPVANKYYRLVSQIRNRLASIGFFEIMTYSFIGAKEIAAVSSEISGAPIVQNPLVSDQQHLRPTLVPQMLGAIRDNQYHTEVIRFFEVGKSFEKVSGGKLPRETHWLMLGLTTSYYDAKGVLYNLLAGLGIGADEIVVRSTNAGYLKAGMSADLFVHGKRLATLGEIREEVRNKFDIKKAVVVASLDLGLLLSTDISEVKFEKFSKFQMVRRDMSAFFGDDVTVADITKKLSRVNKLVKKVEVVDIYSDSKSAQDMRSITIRFTIQSDEHTLTDKEVEDVVAVLRTKITELGGKTRVGNKA